MGESSAEFGGGTQAPQRDGSTHAWRRRLLRWAPRSIGIFILLLLGFLGVDFAAGIKSLGHVRPEFLIPAVGVFCLAVLGRMATWVLIACSLKLGYRRVTSYVRAFVIGWFAGIGVPQGTASFARIVVIAADKRSVGRSVVAVVAERLLQVSVALALLLISSVYLSALSMEVLTWLVVGIAIVLIGGLTITAAVKVGLTRPLSRRLMSYNRIRSFSGEIKDAVSELRGMSVPRLAGILGVILLASMLTVTSLFLATRALDIHIHYVVLIAAWAAVALSGLLPISINGLGPREGILTAAVAGAGFSSEGGVALGLLWFFMQAVTRLTAGLVWLTVLRTAEEDTSSEIEVESSGQSRTGGSIG